MYRNLFMVVIGALLLLMAAAVSETVNAEKAEEDNWMAVSAGTEEISQEKTAITTKTGQEEEVKIAQEEKIKKKTSSLVQANDPDTVQVKIQLLVASDPAEPTKTVSSSSIEDRSSCSGAPIRRARPSRKWLMHHRLSTASKIPLHFRALMKTQTVQIAESGIRNSHPPPQS